MFSITKAIRYQIDQTPFQRQLRIHEHHQQEQDEVFFRSFQNIPRSNPEGITPNNPPAPSSRSWSPNSMPEALPEALPQGINPGDAALLYQSQMDDLLNGNLEHWDKMFAFEGDFPS